MSKEETFEDAVNEYITRTQAMMREDNQEGIPEPPYDQVLPMGREWAGPGKQYGYWLTVTEDRIQRLCRIYGETNPLYADPNYGPKTRYRSQLCPVGYLARVRYPSAHGARRPQGYPVANFISGAAYELYDVLRVNDAFVSAKTQSELLDKKGSRGRLLFLISENFYWTTHGDLVGKCYGTQIMIPMRTMGTSRAMRVEDVGKQMLYTRNVAQYSAKEIAQTKQDLQSEEIRGAVPQYWEDVEVGEQLPPVTLPPWTVQDMSINGIVGIGARSFKQDYLYKKENPGSARTHPLTMWPYSGGEHDDSLIAPYRGQRAAFDFGVQRCQFAARLFTNWMGDDGFLRAWYVALRKMVYYGDITTYRGEVVQKYKVVEKGEAGPGGIPREAEYCAVGIRFAGVNQLGEQEAPGTATIFLPSKDLGPVKLPIPHPPRPPYVPFDTHRKEWYVGAT
jgi:hypothetical protein